MKELRRPRLQYLFKNHMYKVYKSFLSYEWDLNTYSHNVGQETYYSLSYLQTYVLLIQSRPFKNNDSMKCL